MKIFKKIIALFLSLVLTTSSFTFAHANNVKYDDENEFDTIIYEESDNEIVELIELDGTYFYFQDTDEYTLSITKYPSGNVNVVKNDKLNNSLEESIITENQDNEIQMFSARDIDIISEMKLLSERVLDNQIELETDLSHYFENVVTYDEEEVIIDGNIHSNRSVASLIDEELSGEFGSPYNDRLRGGLSYRGYSASLYESMHFTRSKYTSWFINAGTAVGIVASLMGIPTSLVLKIFTYTSIGVGVYSIIADVTGNKYYADVHNNKTVKVKDIYPYRAGRSEYGFCYVGDKSAAYQSRNKVRQDYDFDDNTGLMRKGIDNYIDFN